MDLFWVRGDELFLSRSEHGRFSSQPIGKGSGRPAQLTLADFDRDSDFDIFVAAPHGSRLLINEHGQYQMIDPQDEGLPDNASCANWVDYDNADCSIYTRCLMESSDRMQLVALRRPVY
jgi:hypothetical protein